MKDKDKNKIRNPVAKYSPEFCKPKTFRDRKKHPSDKEQYRDHPLHEPYDRSKSKMDKNNFLLEDEQDYGMWSDDLRREDELDAWLESEFEEEEEESE